MWKPGMYLWNPNGPGFINWAFTGTEMLDRPTLTTLPDSDESVNSWAEHLPNVRWITRDEAQALLDMAIARRSMEAL